jgi:hypothetical protein
MAVETGNKRGYQLAYVVNVTAFWNVVWQIGFSVSEELAASCRVDWCLYTVLYGVQFQKALFF